MGRSYVQSLLHAYETQIRLHQKVVAQRKQAQRHDSGQACTAQLGAAGQPAVAAPLHQLPDAAVAQRCLQACCTLQRAPETAVSTRVLLSGLRRLHLFVRTLHNKGMLHMLCCYTTASTCSCCTRPARLLAGASCPPAPPLASSAQAPTKPSTSTRHTHIPFTHVFTTSASILAATSSNAHVLP